MPESLEPLCWRGSRAGRVRLEPRYAIVAPVRLPHSMNDSIPPFTASVNVGGQPAPCVRRAVIDVGTNSVKLLIGEVQDAVVRPLIETSHQTRLGQGFYPAHVLQPQAIAKTAQVIAEYAHAAQVQGIESIQLIATSAVRDAVNQQDLLDAIRRSSGLEVRIISGEQEATWAFEGITTDPRFAGHELFLLDVGGGSCQCILGHRTTIHYRHSFRMGSVRLFEMVKPSDPPAPSERRRCEALLDDFIHRRLLPGIEPVIRAHPLQGMMLVGTGGTSSLLAALQLELAQFNREKIEAAQLKRTNLAECCDKLWRMPIEERRSLPGLPSNKADIILTGAAIYLAVMRGLGFDILRASTRGMRFGALVSAGKSG